MGMAIKAELSYQKQKLEARGRQMAYYEVGSGDPIVFIHGNPTSSYLWRNVVPEVETCGRCIVPDLIGFGDSDRLPGDDPMRYSFYEHRKFLDAFMESAGATEKVTIVIHDWGSALGFDWARRHSERVKGICYMEAVVLSTVGNATEPADLPKLLEGLGTWMRFREPEVGEKLVLEENAFVEFCLPRWVLGDVSPEVMEGYRRPFSAAGEGRRSILTLARQIPIDGKPADLHETVTDYSGFMNESPLPKLLIRAEPGLAITGELLAFCRRWPNQTEVSVPGLHFLQEDSPREIGQAIAQWYGAL
jgi:haloalkane dehalogenase